eukprot:508165-Hanusia_phi.AAC.1
MATQLKGRYEYASQRQRRGTDREKLKRSSDEVQNGIVPFRMVLHDKSERVKGRWRDVMEKSLFEANLSV